LDNSNDNQKHVSEDEIAFTEAIYRIKEFFYYLWIKWRIIFLMSIVGGIIGAAYSLTNRPVYTAACTFVLEEGAKMGLGQYSGLASIVGVDIGGGGDGLFQGDNIIELYKSRSMIVETLLTKGQFGQSADLLINRFIETYSLRTKWHSQQLKNLNFDIPRGRYTTTHDSVLSIIYREINDKYLSVAKPDKKLSIIKVEFKSANERLAKVFTENLVKNVNDFYIETKSKKAFYNYRILEYQADSVRATLNNSINSRANILDANPNINQGRQILKAPSQKKEIDVQVNSAILQELIKNLEIAKVSLRNETPLIQIIDAPVLPLEKAQLDKLLATIAGSVTFIMVAVLFLFGKWLFKK